MVLAKGRRFYWRIKTSPPAKGGRNLFREKDKGWFYETYLRFVALPGFVGKRMGRGCFALGAGQ
ncbi:hypothetical protein K370107A2_00310 [Merdimmobilis hominis]